MPIILDRFNIQINKTHYVILPEKSSFSRRYKTKVLWFKCIVDDGRFRHSKMIIFLKLDWYKSSSLTEEAGPSKINALIGKQVSVMKEAFTASGF